MTTGSAVTFFILAMTFVAVAMYLTMRLAEDRNCTLRRRRIMACTVLMAGTALTGYLTLFASWSWRTTYELPALFLIQTLVAVSYAAAFVWIIDRVERFFKRTIRLVNPPG